MKKYKYLLLLLPLLLCNSCKPSKLDFEEIYNKNIDFARPYFQSLQSFHDETHFITLKTATPYEYNYFSGWFNLGVDKLFYMNSYEGVMVPMIFEFNSLYEAKYFVDKKLELGTTGLIRRKNIVAVEIFPVYLLLDGKYETIDNYAVTLDKKTLLFDANPIPREDVIVPDSIKTISGYSFIYSSIKSISCNNNLNTIGMGAFFYCEELTNVSLNSKLKLISTLAFCHTNLSKIRIPKSVEIIENRAFLDTTLYCEAKEKPKGWSDNFAEHCNIIYGS